MLEPEELKLLAKSVTTFDNTKVNLELVKEKLIESEVIKRDDEFNIDTLKSMLNNKFNEINYTDAKEDVISFIQDIDSLNLLSL